MGNKQSAAAADEPPPLTAAQHGLQVGDRVQTQWTVEEGGNDQWYPGTVSCRLLSVVTRAAARLRRTQPPCRLARCLRC